MVNPRYDGSPMIAVFECYVLEVLGRLSAEKSAGMAKLNLPKVLQTRAQDWKGAVKEKLHLSDTIAIAIWDLWYTNQEVEREKHLELSAGEFVMGFVDNFLKEGSPIDVWTGESLARAKERIAERRRGSS